MRSDSEKQKELLNTINYDTKVRIYSGKLVPEEYREEVTSLISIHTTNENIICT